MHFIHIIVSYRIVSLKISMTFWLNTHNIKFCILTILDIDLFMVSTILSFSACLIGRFMQNVVFSGRILSLSTIHLKFYVFFVASLLITFYWIILRCMNVPRFVYSFSYWRIPWLLPLSVNYEWSCYECGYRFLCGRRFSTHLGRYLGKWVLGCLVKAMSDLVRNCQTVDQRAVSFCMYAGNEWELLLYIVSFCRSHCFGV